MKLLTLPARPPQVVRIGSLRLLTPLGVETMVRPLKPGHLTSLIELTLPVRMQLVDILSVAVAALLLSLLATLYPAWKAARLLPAETFRYE